MDLKRPLMLKFVKIFLSDAQWKKGLFQNQNSATVPEISNIFAKIKQIRLQNILNPFPWLVFDDVICGTYKNVRINIYESNTNIFNHVTVYLIPFGIIWFTGMTAGLIWILFILLAIVFSWKIIQYAPFRGAIVEIEMNKNFTGHTFFHQKSIAASKIPIDKKKFAQVELEKSGFSDKYRVYSDNQVEARYLLTTAMMERIEHLSFSFNAKSVRGSFKDNKLIGLCEYQGEQHYEPVDFANKGIEWAEKQFERNQISDNIKRTYCKDKDIRLLEIPYWEYENAENIILKFIKEAA